MSPSHRERVAQSVLAHLGHYPAEERAQVLAYVLGFVLADLSDEKAERTVWGIAIVRTFILIKRKIHALGAKS